MTPDRWETQEQGEWVRPRAREFREMCCDCGLVHVVDYKIRRTAGGRPEVWFRVRRDNRATTRARHSKRNKFVCRKERK